MPHVLIDHYPHSFLLSVFICLFFFPQQAKSQLTSSGSVAIPPFLSAESDSELTSFLYSSFLASLRDTKSRSIGVRTDFGREFSREDLYRIFRQPSTMHGFTAGHGAAFLIGGVVTRPSLNELSVALALYGVDDHTVIACENRILPIDETVQHEMEQLARKLTHPSILTPYDTAVMYSIIIPGLGQLAKGEYFHSILSAGLVCSAMLYGRTPFFSNTLDYSEERIKRRRRNMVVLAWLFNIADTFLVCRLKMEQLDITPFFNAVESISGDSDKQNKYQLGLGIRWTIRPSGWN